MKVLLVNGSPHKNGCTFTALSEIEGVLKAAGIVNKDMYADYLVGTEVKVLRGPMIGSNGTIQSVDVEKGTVTIKSTNKLADNRGRVAEFEMTFDAMSISGALYDITKLNSISSEIIYNTSVEDNVNNQLAMINLLEQNSQMVAQTGVMDFDFDLNEGKKTIANLFNSQLESLVVLKFLLVFSFNVLFNIINTSFINFLIYFSIFFIIDFSFNFYIRKRFFALILYTFGLIHFIITCLSFLVSGIICIQFIEIEFIKLSLCFIFIILYAISKKFILNYLLKMKNKFIQKKRGASK